MSNLTFEKFIPPAFAGRIQRLAAWELTPRWLRDPWDRHNDTLPVTLEVAGIEVTGDDRERVRYTMSTDARAQSYDDDCDTFWTFAAHVLVASARVSCPFLRDMDWSDWRIVDLYATPQDRHFMHRRALQLKLHEDTGRDRGEWRDQEKWASTN